MTYRANRNTAIFPFGLIAKGEALRPVHIAALGEDALADLVRRGVFAKIGDAGDTDGQNDAEIGDAGTADVQDVAEIDARDEADQADAPEDELSGLDDLMGEAEPETEAEPEAKKAKRRKAR